MWLLRESAVLNDEAPIDFLLRGECQVVDDLLSRFDGIAVLALSLHITFADRVHRVTPHQGR